MLFGIKDFGVQNGEKPSKKEQAGYAMGRLSIGYAVFKLIHP